jgi:hypothetical protein
LELRPPTAKFDTCTSLSNLCAKAWPQPDLSVTVESPISAIRVALAVAKTAGGLMMNAKKAKANNAFFTICFSFQ